MLHVRLLKLAHILDCVLTGNEAQVLLTLDAQVLKNDFYLVVLADHVELLSSFLLLLFGVLLVVFAGRKREARVSLEEIAYFVELLLELALPFVILDVLK